MALRTACCVALDDVGHNMVGSYSMAANRGWVFSQVMPFPAVRVGEYVSVAQLLSTSVTSLRFSSIFGVAEVGRRL